MDTHFLYVFGIVLKNVRQMLRDRGYDVIAGDGTELAMKAYQRAKAEGCSLGEAVRAVYRHGSDPARSVALWCLDRNYDAVKCRDRMVSTDQVKILGELIEDHDATEHVVLSPNKLSPQAKRESLSDAQVFLFDELLIDLPRHELVPKHSVVDLETARGILGPGLRPEDLPLLPTTDAVARWWNYQPGTIVMVHNPTMPTFRFVVKA